MADISSGGVVSNQLDRGVTVAAVAAKVEREQTDATVKQVESSGQTADQQPDPRDGRGQNVDVRV